MNFQPCFKVYNLVSVHPKSMKLGQITNLNVIVDVQLIDWLKFETRDHTCPWKWNSNNNKIANPQFPVIVSTSACTLRLFEKFHSPSPRNSSSTASAIKLCRACFWVRALVLINVTTVTQYYVMCCSHSMSWRNVRVVRLHWLQWILLLK